MRDHAVILRALKDLQKTGCESDLQEDLEIIRKKSFKNEENCVIMHKEVSQNSHFISSL